MDKGKQEVMDHDVGPYEEVEKMKRSPSKSCDVYADQAIAVRECNICGKTFSNGKALGGHRRSHFQVAKRHSQKVKTLYSYPSKTGNNKAICDDDGKQKHTCFHCKRNFPSKNALFGHMRSHPERDWRGVCPPTVHTPSCSLSTSDSMEKYKESDCDDDFVGKDKASLPRWQKTDKRGRRSIGAYEAAEILVYIRCSYFCAEPKNPEAIAEEPSSSEKHVLKKVKFYVSGSLKCENKNDGDVDCDGVKVNKGKSSSGITDEKISASMKEADWAKEWYCVKQDDVGFFDEKIKEMVKKKKKINKLLLTQKTRDSGSEDKGFVDKTDEKKLNGYECDICWKSFPIFQALEGHKSIQNNVENIITMAKPKPNSDAIAEYNIGTETLNNEEASSSQFVGAKILDFDLNKSPDDMHDD